MSLLRLQFAGGASDASVREPDLIHVLLVIDQLGEVLGGGERVALRLASCLPRYGFRASILTFSMHVDSPMLQQADCPIYFLPLRRTYDFGAFRAAHELSRFLREQDVRVVQTFFESSDLWAGLVTRLTSPARLVWSRRDMGILRTRKHQVAYRLMSRLPHAVVAVSEQVRRFTIAVDRICPDRVHTIYNGIDVDEYRNSPRTQGLDEIRIATVGNIRRVKGHDVLLKAAPLILERFPGAVFNIAGQVLEQEYFNELQELALQLGVADRVRFEGGVEDLPQYLTGVDVFVLPSRSEGFSNSLVEAMAASLPVVATNVGGNSEAIEDGVTGFVIPAEDPAALAGAVIRLLSDRASARAMGEAGRRRVTQEFTIQAMMQHTVDVYRRLLPDGVRLTSSSLARNAQ